MPPRVTLLVSSKEPGLVSPSQLPGHTERQRALTREALFAHFAHYHRASCVERLTSPQGAPRVRVDGTPVPVSFSHTTRFVVIASGESPLGVDIEETQRFHTNPSRALAIAARLWPDVIASALRALPPDAVGRAFIRLWTIFEASAKRHERGIGRTSLSLTKAQLWQVCGDSDFDSTFFRALPREETDADAFALCERNEGVTMALSTDRLGGPVPLYVARESEQGTDVRQSAP